MRSTTSVNASPSPAGREGRRWAIMATVSDTINAKATHTPRRSISRALLAAITFQTFGLVPQLIHLGKRHVAERASHLTGAALDMVEA